MPTYTAPVDDFRFVLNELLAVTEQTELPGYADLTPDMLDAILEGAAKVCEEVLQPVNQVGDEEGCTFENGVVRTPTGFKEAYRTFCDGGWNRLGAPEAYGGAGLPTILTMAVSEMSTAANQALSMYVGLTNAAYASLMGFGDEFMKSVVVPKMVSGEWTGTMNLTEPHCGTDLKLMKTKAVEQPDGTFRLTGTKIFISGGEHDMVDNIIHMVIAKVPDEDGKLHDDLSTVNFFMVPKYLVNEDGTLGERNGVFCGSIEKKMGIKGNATAVLNYEDAVAYRVGPRPSPRKTGGGNGTERSSSRGMAGMFAMMNAARLGVGLQGVALAEVAYQNAAEYARERLQGRSLTGPKNPDGPADPIIVHPDVRRMLMQVRSFVEGARALMMWVSMQMAVARAAKDEKARERAGDMADLLTPVIKAYFTDMGFEATNLAMQCYGGHGYVRDHGMEQFVRDSRILPIYEGANGIQALDLVGRKLRANGGRSPLNFFAIVREFLNDIDGDEALTPYSGPLAAGLGRLEQATLWLAEKGPENPDNAGAASADYLRLFGTVALGFMWARMAQVATVRLNDIAAGRVEERAGADRAFYERKLVTGRYWMERAMPDTAALLERIKAGSDTLMAFEAAAF